MKHISIHAFREVVEAESGNPNVDFINVCTPGEYKEKHIPGVRNVPLDELEAHLDEFRNKRRLYIHCRSGKRGTKAMERLAALGVEAELINVEGGLMAWDEAGYHTRSETSRLPIIRQTLIAAGFLVVLGYFLSLTVHWSFILLSVFVGAGLMFAGVTGRCGLSLALARMPWNR